MDALLSSTNSLINYYLGVERVAMLLGEVRLNGNSLNSQARTFDKVRSG